jgi:putative exosortase-associated protein (TIGR04073 family)
MPKTTKVKMLSTTVLAVTMFCLLSPTRASAQDDIRRERSEVGQMTHKLGRGVINIMTGWIEIPKTIAAKWRETDPATGFVMGFIQGTGWAFCRTAAGGYDVVTFPFDAPAGYAPLLEPEFILPSIWGEELPITDLNLDN